MTRICDLMHKGVIFCHPDDNAKAIAKMMKANNIRSVVVADRAGEVCGLVSTMELLALYGRKLNDFRAEEIMRPFKFEVDPQWPVENAIRLMKQKKIEHLIIVDPHAGPRQPVGILTSLDIVQYMSGFHAGKHEQLLKMQEE